MRKPLIFVASLALLIAPASSAFPGPLTDDAQAPESESRNNGVVMMIHGHVDPDPTGPTPAPPAHEAFVATNEGGTVRLAVIPFSPNETGTWTPNDLSDENPELLVVAPGADDVWKAPNVDPANHPRCTDETTIKGHEGPLSACLVFEFDAGTFDGRNAPVLQLHWDDGVEVYNSVAHVLMHDRFAGGPLPVSFADGLTGEPTPFLVGSPADPGP